MAYIDGNRVNTGFFLCAGLVPPSPVSSLPTDRRHRAYPAAADARGATPREKVVAGEGSEQAPQTIPTAPVACHEYPDLEGSAHRVQRRKVNLLKPDFPVVGRLERISAIAVPGHDRSGAGTITLHLWKYKHSADTHNTTLGKTPSGHIFYCFSGIGILH